jgi:hypothetical protein
MAIPKDGATTRHESRRDNRMVQKKKHEKEVNYEALRKKIDTGAIIDKLVKSDGWDLLLTWINTDYSFRELARIEESDPNELARKIQKGAAFAAMQDWCNLKILEGQQANKILDEQIALETKKK